MAVGDGGGQGEEGEATGAETILGFCDVQGQAVVNNSLKDKINNTRKFSPPKGGFFLAPAEG